MSQRYNLTYFSDRASQPWSSYQLWTVIRRANNLLHVEWQLQGHLSILQVPEVVLSPQRRDHLWQTTCFEFFFGTVGQPEYWEVNLSPNLDWNVYRFSSYREGMTPETSLATVEHRLTRSPSGLTMECELPLPPLGVEEQSLELNVSTVLQTQAGEISYWAVTHAPEEADFHHRSSFTIKI